MDSITLMDGSSVSTTDVRLPDGGVAKEFVLPSGSFVVRVRPVPPMLVAEVLDDNPELAEPPIPLVEVKGATTKSLPARPGEPEYDEYLAERKRREKLRDAAQSDLTWDYGIVGWKLVGEDEFETDPPGGWKLPAILKEYGKKPRPGKRGRRVDYIKYALVTRAKDMEVVQMAMYGMSSPLSRGEVDAASGLFPGDEVWGTVAGETGESH